VPAKCAVKLGMRWANEVADVTKMAKKKGGEIEKKIKKKNDLLICSGDSFSGAGTQFPSHGCVEPVNPLQKFLF